MNGTVNGGGVLQQHGERARLRVGGVELERALDVVARALEIAQRDVDLGQPHVYFG